MDRSESGKVFKVMIDAGKQEGHEFVCVTARRNTDENCEVLNSFLDKWKIQMPIVFTAFTPNGLILTSGWCAIVQ